MSIFFSHPYSDFLWNTGLFTISTWPVIISSSWDKILLHISSSTGKYQFIWGRLDDSFSFRENALMRAKEVVWDNQIFLTEDDPTILLDTILRDGISEKILLIHYKAHIENELDIGDAKWFSLSEIENLHISWNTSSPNIIIASRHFLSK
jgi:hypothetical protein